ncbi:MAG: peptide chain release factor 2 [Gammaproteobacteria bacterium RIFCSPHIGHO2_12_FULL_40_19]|nr:MAG: peptide chain release factor 2 [Gammaproteobacteria bacterium RIFCSPHIGHO2_12_FULL_40_19]
MIEVRRELEDPDIWNLPEKAQVLGKERAQLEINVEGLEKITQRLRDADELLDIAKSENDDAMFDDIKTDVDEIEKHVERLEFQRMFSGEMDANNAYLEIQSGSGGTEAQDWAEMILRMYLRWCDQHGFAATIESISAGEVAGIKHATVYVEGSYAFGWLRTETGVHRLVRKSPFDSGNRRHTSFAAVFVSPEIDDDIPIEINMGDVRVDTFRASGAGGQHVNKTDSAIRMTHIPTNTVVQCQSDRSQHKNRASALKQLKAKLYELEMQKKREKQDAIEDTKMDISWGSQIRSYVLDQARIKDLRTGVERTDTQKVLDGDLDKFIEATLKHQVG